MPPAPACKITMHFAFYMHVATCIEVGPITVCRYDIMKTKMSCDKKIVSMHFYLLQKCTKIEYVEMNADHGSIQADTPKCSVQMLFLKNPAPGINFAKNLSELALRMFLKFLSQFSDPWFPDFPNLRLKRLALYTHICMYACM